MSKTKVRIDPRSEAAAPVRYVTSDQIDLEEVIDKSGWDNEDPGRGTAVIAPDGREILNPNKFAEPADIEAGQDMFEVMERRIMQKLRAGLFTGDEYIEETPDERNDFDVADDVLYVSGFEVEMASEFPNFPAPAPRPNEELAAEVDRDYQSLDPKGVRPADEPLPASRGASGEPSPPVGGDEGGPPKAARRGGRGASATASEAVPK